MVENLGYNIADYFKLKNASDGGKILVKSEIKSGEIIIPDELGITEIGKKAFANSMFSYYKITKIKSNTVKIIRKEAFRACHDLKSASFPMVETIEEGAFEVCGKLETIDFHKIKKIRKSGFRNCHSLKNASFPMVETIEPFAFSGCNDLESVSFPMVETIGKAAFRNCLTLSTFSGSPNVRYIGDDAFTRTEAVRSEFTRAGKVRDYSYKYYPLSFNVREQLGFKTIEKLNTFRYEKIILDSDIQNEKNLDSDLEARKEISNDGVKRYAQATSSSGDVSSNNSTIIIMILAIVGVCCIGLMFLFIIGLSVS